MSRWPGHDVQNSGKPPEPLNVQELEKLIPELQSFVKENRGSRIAAKAQVDLARALFETGQYEEAVTLSINALENLPRDLDLRALLSDISWRSRMQRWEKAMRPPLHGMRSERKG
jgi:tetratricopeptide (TPR) repeat protein